MGVSGGTTSSGIEGKELKGRGRGKPCGGPYGSTSWGATMKLKLEGNGNEVIDALKVFLGETKARGYAALAALNQMSIKEAVSQTLEADMDGDFGSVVFPGFLIPLNERPPCDRGKKGLERFLKEWGMTRAEFEEMAATGNCQGRTHRTKDEVEISREWLGRVRREESKSRSREVGNFLHKQGIKVKPS